MKPYIQAMVFSALIPFAAQAEGLFDSLYVRGGGGVNLVADQDFDTGADAVGVVDTELDSGVAAKVAIGSLVGDIRTEFEFSFSDNDVDVHSVGGMNLPGSVGEFMAFTYMFNALYELDEVFGLEGVTPYAGAGIGVAAADFSDYTVEGVPSVLNDEDASIAFQIILGADVSVSEQVGLFVDYHFLTAPDLEIETDLGANTSDIDHESHTVYAGVRLSF